MFSLQDTEDLLRYISVRPKGSLFYLRQKLWHLLELPDFCDEVIILRSSNGIEIPLTELRRGNKPENPFVLEVWQSKIQMFQCSRHDRREALTLHQVHPVLWADITDVVGDVAKRDADKSMLDVQICCNEPENMPKYGSKYFQNAICEITTAETSLDTVLKMDSNHRETFLCDSRCKEDDVSSSMSRMNKLKEFDGKACGHRNVIIDYNMNSRLSSKLSTSSIRFSLPGRKKSKDNFANMLLKIQNDLSVLSGKIVMLDNKIQR